MQALTADHQQARPSTAPERATKHRRAVLGSVKESVAGEGVESTTSATSKRGGVLLPPRSSSTGSSPLSETMIKEFEGELREFDNVTCTSLLLDTCVSDTYS